MKIFTWIQMSILVALVISWPLILLGAGKEVVGLIALAGGAVAMRVGSRRPPNSPS